MFFALWSDFTQVVNRRIEASMRLFRKKPASPLLRNRLDALTTRVNQAEHDLRILKLEWQETLDKVTRLMSRVAKRAAIDNPMPHDPPPDPPDEFSNMDPISAEIHRRRAGGMNS